jgi:hypothetical protein
MSELIPLLKMVPVLLAAILIGNWYLAEFKKARAMNKPWYAPYLSLPGLMVIGIILLPVVVWWIRR